MPKIKAVKGVDIEGGQKRETLIYQRKSQFRFFCLKGGSGRGAGRGGGGL